MMMLGLISNFVGGESGSECYFVVASTLSGESDIVELIVCYESEVAVNEW